MPLAAHCNKWKGSPQNNQYRNWSSFLYDFNQVKYLPILHTLPFWTYLSFILSVHVNMIR